VVRCRRSRGSGRRKERARTHDKLRIVSVLRCRGALLHGSMFCGMMMYSNFMISADQVLARLRHGQLSLALR
jgi:hypothetical protein